MYNTVNEYCTVVYCTVDTPILLPVASDRYLVASSSSLGVSAPVCYYAGPLKGVSSVT